MPVVQQASMVTWAARGAMRGTSGRTAHSGTVKLLTPAPAHPAGSRAAWLAEGAHRTACRGGLKRRASDQWSAAQAAAARQNSHAVVCMHALVPVAAPQ